MRRFDLPLIHFALWIVSGTALAAGFASIRQWLASFRFK